MEKDGVDEKVYLNKSSEEATKGKEALDVKHVQEAELRERLAVYEDEAFDAEEWLKDRYIIHRSVKAGTMINVNCFTSYDR